MTRDEFTRYIFEGEQWTPATLAAARMAQDGFVPTCDAETFEREINKPDGIVPVKREESSDTLRNSKGYQSALKDGLEAVDRASMLARQKAINDAHDKIVDLSPNEWSKTS